MKSHFTISYFYLYDFNWIIKLEVFSDANKNKNHFELLHCSILSPKAEGYPDVSCEC